MVGRNIKFLKLQKFLSSIWPLEIFVLVYFATITDSYAVAAAVLSMTSVIQGVMEVPTGIFSDKIGRKKTMVLACVLFFIAILLWALAGTFNSVLLLFIGGFISGFAQSFNSGTTEAFMYETMEELEKTEDFDKLFSSGAGLENIGYFISGFINIAVVLMFNSSPQSLLVLAWVTTLPVLGELVTVLFCVEPKIKSRETNNISSLGHFKEALKLMFTNKKIRIFAIINIFARTATTCVAKISPAYYVQLVPLYLVPVVSMIGDLFTAISYFIASRFKKFGLGKLLFVSEYFMAGIMFIAVVVNNFLTPFINMITGLFDGVSGTSQMVLLQKEFSAKQRATMSSIISSFTAFMTAIIFYGLGVIADVYSFRVSMFIIILMKLSITIYTFFKFKKLKL